MQNLDEVFQLGSKVKWDHPWKGCTRLMERGRQVSLRIQALTLINAGADYWSKEFSSYTF